MTATCPAGSKAVSGGWSAGLYADPLSEGPSPDGAGWTVSFATGHVARLGVRLRDVPRAVGLAP